MTAMCSVSVSRSAPAIGTPRVFSARLMASVWAPRVRVRIRMPPGRIGSPVDSSRSLAVEPAGDGVGDAVGELHLRALRRRDGRPGWSSPPARASPAARSSARGRPGRARCSRAAVWTVGPGSRGEAAIGRLGGEDRVDRRRAPPRTERKERCSSGSVQAKPALRRAAAELAAASRENHAGTAPWKE